MANAVMTGYLPRVVISQIFQRWGGLTASDGAVC
jgi:hypothetical protein